MRFGKSLVIALLAVLSVCSLLLFSVYKDVKEQIVRDLNGQQMIMARQAARGIQDHMAQIVGSLEFLSQLPQIIAMDAEGQRVMEYFLQRHGHEVNGVTRVDASGRITHSVPHKPETIGRDISGQEHMRQILRTQKPVISDVFTAVQGFRTIAVHVPVFDQGRFDGTIAFLLSFDALARRYIENIRIGANGYAWVLSEKGYELSCPVPGHVGKPVTETCRDFPDILAMADKMLQRQEGITTYHFDRVRGTAVERLLKHAVYAPIPIANTFWSIVVATPEDEILASMEGFRLKFSGITFALLGSCIACTYLFVTARIGAKEQRKRDAIGKALQESEALYRALIETTNTGFLVMDRDGTVLDANQEYVRLTGRRDLDDVRGKNVLDGTADSEREKSEQAFASCAREGLVRNLEIDYVHASGQTTSVEINATAVEHNGNVRILGICRDVTERAKLEAQLAQAQKMESVGRLAGGVAHDFNNMLNVINGYAELALMKTAPGDPLHGNLQEILSAGQRSANLTRQLLAFARKQLANPSVLDLNDVVSGMLKMLQRLIGENISLAWVPGHDLWPVRVDPSQVDQILANLAVNAKDAISDVGKVTIETSNEALDDVFSRSHVGCVPGEYVRLAVSDNGCGMSKEALANAFEPFFTTKAVGQGTGLGLATVYGIVKQNGGFVEIVSEAGMGTAVKVYLPRHRGAYPEKAHEVPSGSLDKGSETLLLVEDDEAVLNLSRGVLETLGYKVLIARRPEEAISQAREFPGSVHLIITDVVMPEMNGKELMERLTRIRPAAKCLYMSGYTSDVIAHHGILDEGLNFIQKPFSIGDFARKVRETLDQKGSV